MASTYRYAVKVIRFRRWHWWSYWCQGCQALFGYWKNLDHAYRWAVDHSANCEQLHRANHAAYCPECDRWGRVAAACPLCLGEGWIPTTDAARKGLT